MTRSQTYLLTSLSLAIALLTSPALGAPKGTFKVKSSAANQVRSPRTTNFNRATALNTKATSKMLPSSPSRVSRATTSRALPQSQPLRTSSGRTATIVKQGATKNRGLANSNTANAAGVRALTAQSQKKSTRTSRARPAINPAINQAAAAKYAAAASQPARTPTATTVRVGNIRPGMLKNGIGINPAKLNDLKTRLDGISTKTIGDAQGRFLSETFGPAFKGGTRVGSVLDQMQNAGGSGRSKNPVDQAMGNQLVIGRGAMVSDEPAGEGKATKDTNSTWQKFKNFAGAAFDAALGTAEFPALPFWSLLTAPGVAEDPRDIGQAIKTFGRMQNGDYYDRRVKEAMGTDKTPVPDRDTGGSTTFITREQVAGLQGRFGGASTPTGEGSSGGGGPVNGMATHGGVINSMAQFVGENATTTSITEVQLKAIQARLKMRINPVVK